MMEIDWSLGEITKALDTAGIADETLVIFTSDNGPWLSYGEHSGKTKFREGKGTIFDGGVRSACIMKLPGQLEAGSTSDQTFCSIDILPTIAHLTGAALPVDKIDGQNQWELISGVEGAENPQTYYPLSNGRQFQGLLTGDGRWKWHIPHPYRTMVGVEGQGKDGLPVKYNREQVGPALFDMVNDPLESTNVMDQHPDVAARLKDLAARPKRNFIHDDLILKAEKSIPSPNMGCWVMQDCHVGLRPSRKDTKNEVCIYFHVIVTPHQSLHLS